MKPALLLLAALFGAPEAPSQSSESSTYVGRAFVFRADTEDPEELAEIERVLVQRLRSSGRFAEATVALEADGRLAVTFVGDQPASTEAYLVAGLSVPARLAVRFDPSQEDLARAGVDPAVENARLAVQLAEGGLTLTAVNRLSRDEGGPPAGLAWIGTRAAPRLVRAAPHRVPLDPAAERPLAGFAGTADGALRLELQFDAVLREAVDRAQLESGHGEAVLTLDGEVLGTWPGPCPLAVRARRPMDPAEARALLFAFAGGPLPGPLELDERTTRPLEHVRGR